MSLATPLTTFRGSLSMGLVTESRPTEAGGKFKAGLIPGFAVATRGEALGHGLWLDIPFVGAVKDAMAANTKGLKVRFTHPDMSSDGLAKGLGRGFFTESNSDDVARGDLHLWQSSRRSPDGDLGGHVLQRASEDPESFGASIVFMRDVDAEIEFMLDNGATLMGNSDDWFGEQLDLSNFISPDPLNTKNLPHARLAELRGVDIVDDPAANPNGLFGRDKTFQEVESLLNYSLGLSAEKPELCSLGIDPDRAGSFLMKYLKRNGIEMTKPKTTGKAEKLSDEKPEEVTPPAPTEVVEEVKEDEVATPAEVPVDAMAAYRAELNRYMDAFGKENGAEWFASGVSFADASGKLIAQQKAEIELLKKKLAVASESEIKPLSSDDDGNKKRNGFASKIRIAAAGSRN